ncbi:hypothetical protein FHW00_004001 [Ochrobactrum sp. P6BSIII]|nr:hypothetical protein [Ochrobactrum sp. P6BSIII]
MSYSIRRSLGIVESLNDLIQHAAIRIGFAQADFMTALF